MIRLIKSFILSKLIVTIVFVSACSMTKDKRETLASIDTHGNEIKVKTAIQSERLSEAKTTDEVLDAYYEYIASAPIDDKNRTAAISRLAEIELEQSLFADAEEDERNNIADDIKYIETIQKTIKLLQSSLLKQTHSEENDTLLYQLAQAYEQIEERELSISALDQLVEKYPNSAYFAEAKFRIAENFFITSNYSAAEDSYTEVILAPNNSVLYERALFKRAWSKYKQMFYLEAIDDYVSALEFHTLNANEIEKIRESVQFQEHLRAIALSFSNLGGATAIFDYFGEESDFIYLFDIYLTLSDMHLRQQRFSDAVDILQQFKQSYTLSKHVPQADLKIVKIWQESRFIKKLHPSIEAFYQAYQPKSTYWETYQSETIKKEILIELKNFIVMSAKYFHSLYQEKSSITHFRQAQTWYQRHLEHYPSYARQDKIFVSYAELLDQAGETEMAMTYFEKAAYDGDIILDKDAAYATVVLSDDILKNSKEENKKQWINKKLHYTKLFSELYPNDAQKNDNLLRAIDLAYKSKQYNKAIELTQLLPTKMDLRKRFIVNSIKSQSLMKLKKYQEAESIYLEINENTTLSAQERNENNERLALSLYQQGVQERKENRFDSAMVYFMKTLQHAPKSNIAATGVYDAIALSIQQKMWKKAIEQISIFNKNFPTHRLKNDVSKKLSVAYLNSDQDLKAAKEFERLSSIESDQESKRTSLLQAAKLYNSKKEFSSAIRAYRDYCNRYTTPFADYMEAMHALSELYLAQNNIKKAYFWHVKTRRTNDTAPRSAKTDRTEFIAASALFNLAKEKQTVFLRRKLKEPLQESLRLKKADMQSSVKYYGQASAFGIANILTASTHAIGDIYYEFSRSLLSSERPKALKGEELEQYNILLEDQAFPFEDKAIEFYETNLRRTKNDLFDESIQKSFESLKTLFPARYRREGRIEGYINEIF